MIDADTARFTVDPFRLGEWPQVRAVMIGGYAQSDPAWWDAGIGRVRDVPPNSEDAPLGVVLRRGGEAVGAALLFRSRRPGAPPERWMTSASSWVILDPWRSRALSMARQAMADERHVYTALTPIPSAQRMLQRLGFRPVSHQLLLSLTPRWRSAPGGKSMVRTGPDALAALADHPLAAACQDHARLGLLVLALETDSGWEPLVWRTTRRLRWLRTAELIYVRSQSLATQHAGALARALLGRGYALMAMEGHEELLVEHPCTRLFQRRFARGDYPLQGIDHLYSELVYLHR